MFGSKLGELTKEFGIQHPTPSFGESSHQMSGVWMDFNPEKKVIFGDRVR